MPNNVTNVIEANSEVIQSMLNKEGSVDFCKIFPKHGDLNMGESFGICMDVESAA
ncbi:hypothetical protein [Photorhabdus asymbiotica]|uniref:hypothetical protein n=1 Tax=Photorhabdus asymbiotica TaxID=291112 RepID=UPI003DA72478